MPTNDYQDLVQFIERSLHSKNAKVTSARFEKGAGLSHFREIDILIEDSFGPHTFKVAVEATDLGRKLGAAKYDSLYNKYRGPHHLPVTTFIIVTRRGFTEDVIEKAALDDVELITLDQAKVKDWPALVERTAPAFTEWAPRICRVGFTPTLREVIHQPNFWAEARFRCSHGTDMGSVLEYLQKYFKNVVLKHHPDSLKTLTEKARSTDQGGAMLNVEFEPCHQFFIKLNGNEYPIERINFAVLKEYRKGTSAFRYYERKSTKEGSRLFLHNTMTDGKMTVEMAMAIQREGGRLIPPKSLFVKFGNAGKSVADKDGDRERRRKRRK